MIRYYSRDAKTIMKIRDGKQRNVFMEISRNPLEEKKNDFS